MTRAHAHPDTDFKRCCMLSGEFDGSDRDYFFQVDARVRNGAWSGAMASLRCFSGVIFALVRGTLPDFGPIFEAYANDLKREGERSGGN